MIARLRAETVRPNRLALLAAAALAVGVLCPTPCCLVDPQKALRRFQSDQLFEEEIGPVLIDAGRCIRDDVIAYVRNPSNDRRLYCIDYLAWDASPESIQELRRLAEDPRESVYMRDSANRALRRLRR